MANVDHIIVLGHYGCKSVETAITLADDASDQVKAWVKPIRQLYKDSKRQVDCAYKFLFLTWGFRQEIVKLRDSRMPQRGQPNGITAAPPSTDRESISIHLENLV